MAISFYEVVVVADVESTRSLGIAAELGVVVGKPPHLLGVADEPPLQGVEGQFAIDVDGTVYALSASEIIPTGQILSSETFQSGVILRVDPQDYRPGYGGDHQSDV